MLLIVCSLIQKHFAYFELQSTLSANFLPNPGLHEYHSQGEVTRIINTHLESVLLFWHLALET
jgi:hypothetical protein